MEGLNFKKHKQSRYFTIMLVPYSSKKTISIKIPHWFLYLIIPIAVIILTLVFILRSQTNYFKQQADTISERLTEAWQINSELSKEKAKIEIDARSKDVRIQNQQETYQETLEQERELYSNQLKAYEEKARELEQKIEELDIMKNEIFNLLSQKAENMVNINVSFNNVIEESSNGITLLKFTPDNLGTEYLRIEEQLETEYLIIEQKLETQALDFGKLYNEAKKVKEYLNAKPNIWPVWGIVTSEVGDRSNPFGGPGGEWHTGIDIAVPTGTNVKASGAGKVVYAEWSPGYGYLVTIDHGYGIITMYGHNSKILVNEGQWVSRGDIIAKSGSTGRSTGPHVHYELKVNGVIKNPRKFID